MVGHTPPRDRSPDRVRLRHPRHLAGGAFHSSAVVMVCRVVGGSPGGLRDGDLAGFASETVGTQAVIIVDAVIALCPVFARLAGAVVDVDGAETPFEAHLALAGEAVDPVVAGGTVGTGTHQAVIHIILTEIPDEASKAPTGEVAGKAIFILTLPSILARRPCLLTWPRLHLTVLPMEAFWTQARIFPVSIVDALSSILAWGELVFADVYVFVTELAGPAGVTDALPRLVARPVETPRHTHAVLAVLALPAWVAPALPILVTAAVGKITALAAVITLGKLVMGQEDPNQGHELETEAPEHGQRGPTEMNTSH